MTGDSSTKGAFAMTPQTHRSSRQGQAALERVVGVAITEFAERGFSATKMEKLSTLSGMSKRMIHYHFTDKAGLYHRAVDTALQRVLPDIASLESHSPVAVDDMRALIDVAFERMAAHPTEVQLLARLEQDKPGREALQDSVEQISELSKYLNKLLIRGQDAGAFRPGISAADIFYLMTTLSMAHISHRGMMDRVWDVALDSDDNRAGAHRLATDAVIAFLTSNLPATEHSSYLSEADHEDATADIYGTDAYGDDTYA